MAATFLVGLAVFAATPQTPNTRADAAPTPSAPTSAARAHAADVGCQGRVMPPKNKVARLAAPTDQGAPIVARLVVDEGGEVEAGAVLAVLAAETPARLLERQAAAKLAAAQAAVKTADASAARASSEAALQILDAKIALADATAALLSAQSPRRRATDAAVAAAQAARDEAKAALARLRTDRPVFAASLDATVAAARVRVAESSWGAGRIAAANLAEAEAARLNTLREYDTRTAAAAGELAVLDAKLAAVRDDAHTPERDPADLPAATERVAAARERTAAAEKHAAAVAAAAEATVAEARAAVAEATLTQELAAARLALTSIRAPFKGRVLRVFARTGEAVGPAGVAEIADLSQMTVEAEVNVADIARVRLGAKAVVSLPGRKESFAGKVAAIGLRVVAGALADDNPAAFKDQRVVPVVVELDAAASAALSGLSAAQAQVRISGE